MPTVRLPASASRVRRARDVISSLMPSATRETVAVALADIARKRLASELLGPFGSRSRGGASHSRQPDLGAVQLIEHAFIQSFVQGSNAGSRFGRLPAQCVPDIRPGCSKAFRVGRVKNALKDRPAVLPDLKPHFHGLLRQNACGPIAQVHRRRPSAHPRCGAAALTYRKRGGRQVQPPLTSPAKPPALPERIEAVLQLRE